MRDRAYWLVALVAWPALVWCVIEAALRLASGYSAGTLQLALTGACAAGTIVAVRMRRAALVATPPSGRDHDRR